VRRIAATGRAFDQSTATDERNTERTAGAARW
jgi:hypothetical protein